jgi:hypothetical protein
MDSTIVAAIIGGSATLTVGVLTVRAAKAKSAPTRESRDVAESTPMVLTAPNESKLDPHPRVAEA